MEKLFAVRTDSLEFAYEEGRENKIFKVYKTDTDKIKKFKEWKLDKTNDDESQQEYLGVYLVDTEDSNILEEFNLIGYVKDVRDEGILSSQDILNISSEPITAKCITARFFDTDENLVPHLLLELKPEIKDNTDSNTAILSEVELAMDRVIKEDILTYEECMERINLCTLYNVFPEDIVLIFNSMRKYSEESARVKKPNVIFVHDNLSLMIWNFNKGNHLAFYGLASTGKNTAADTISWLYNRPIRTISCHSQIDTEVLLGKDSAKFTPNESGEGINSFEITYVKGQVIKAMENGEILILDEVNTMNPSIITSLNSVLDYRGNIEIPDYGVVKSDKNFITIITFNKDFQGTGQLQEAFKTRFFHTEFELLESIEKILIANVPNYNLDKVKLIDAVYKNLLQNVKSTDIKSLIEPTSFSIRGLIRACHALSDRPFDEREDLIKMLLAEADNDDDKIKITAAVENALRICK